MTTLSQSTKRKLSLLQLAEELGNVSKACKIMGYHRDTFYEVRRAFQVGGVAALVEEKRVLRTCTCRVGHAPNILPSCACIAPLQPIHCLALLCPQTALFRRLRPYGLEVVLCEARATHHTDPKRPSPWNIRRIAVELPAAR